MRRATRACDLNRHSVRISHSLTLHSPAHLKTTQTRPPDEVAEEDDGGDTAGVDDEAAVVSDDDVEEVLYVACAFFIRGAVANANTPALPTPFLLSRAY